MQRIAGAVLAGSLLAAGAIPAVAVAASAGTATAGATTTRVAAVGMKPPDTQPPGLLSWGGRPPGLLPPGTRPPGLLPAGTRPPGPKPAGSKTGSKPAGTANGVTVTVLRGGLNTPRHLTLTRAGLFVAQAGAGGTNKADCVTGPVTGGAGTTQYCTGLTGAVTLVGRYVAKVSLRLPSALEQDDKEAAGPSAIAFDQGGQAVVMQDVLVHKDGSSSLAKPLGTAFGKLLVWQGRKQIAVNLASFAAAHPQQAHSLGTLPGETAWDSDPYDVVAYHGGFVVADAAANSLLKVSASGQISLLARFPAVKEKAAANTIGNPAPVTIEAQAVPTSVAVGPDGALYVGLLRGVPSDKGTAYIYRVVPGHKPMIWAHGLTAVTAIAFDSHGDLLVTEYGVDGLLAPPTVPGALVRISCHGHTVTTLGVSGLYQPTGVAVGPGGVVYVSNYGDNLATASHPGEILQITGLS